MSTHGLAKGGENFGSEDKNKDRDKDKDDKANAYVNSIVRLASTVSHHVNEFDLYDSIYDSMNQDVNDRKGNLQSSVRDVKSIIVQNKNKNRNRKDLVSLNSKKTGDMNLINKSLTSNKASMSGDILD